MPLTAYLLQIPSFLLLVLMLAGSTAYAYFGLKLIRRRAPKDILKSHNDIAGFVFATLGVTYAVILAFVVITVWEQMSDARERSQLESESAIAFYHNLQLIDKTDVLNPAVDQLERYVDMVIEREYPAMKKFQNDKKTTEEFNKIWAMIYSLKPSNDKEIVIYDHLLTSLTKITEYRAMRFHDMDDQVPSVLWFTIIIGGIITVGFTWIFGSENMNIHIIISCSLSLLIGLVIFVILILDHPYTGELSIQPVGYEILRTMMQQ